MHLPHVPLGSTYITDRGTCSSWSMVSTYQPVKPTLCSRLILEDSFTKLDQCLTPKLSTDLEIAATSWENKDWIRWTSNGKLHQNNYLTVFRYFKAFDWRASIYPNTALLELVNLCSISQLQKTLVASRWFSIWSSSYRNEYLDLAARTCDAPCISCFSRSIAQTSNSATRTSEHLIPDKHTLSRLQHLQSFAAALLLVDCYLLKPWHAQLSWKPKQAQATSWLRSPARPRIELQATIGLLSSHWHPAPVPLRTVTISRYNTISHAHDFFPQMISPFLACS